MQMDGYTGFNVTFAMVRLNGKAGTTVMRSMAYVTRMKLPSNMAALGPEVRSSEQK